MASGTRNELRVFVDSSVFFAAAFSESGPARALLSEASRGACLLLISDLVIEETVRNLGRHAPAAVAVFHELRHLPCIRLAPEPSKIQVARIARIVNLKDAPIIAAAVRARAGYVATHDRELLRQAVEIAQNHPVRVVSPGDLLPVLRAI